MKGETSMEKYLDEAGLRKVAGIRSGDKEELKGVIAHEFGHNLGLSHPSESMINNPEYKGNIMWQRDHPKAGKSPNKTQLLYIYNNPRSYNKHSNIYPKYK